MKILLSPHNILDTGLWFKAKTMSIQDFISLGQPHRIMKRSVDFVRDACFSCFSVFSIKGGSVVTCAHNWLFPGELRNI